MGAIVFILFCFGVLAAVICIIIYFSSSGNAKAAQSVTTAIQKRGDTAMDKYDYHPVKERSVDDNYYKEKILELRESPNMINDLFLQWHSRFKSRRERGMLKELEEWYTQMKTLSGAQAAAMLERMRAQDARIDLETANTKEYLEERKDTKILTQRADNEELRAKIAEAQGRQKQGAAGKQDRTKRSAEEVRTNKEKWFDERMKDKFSELKSKDAARKRADLWEQEELDELDADETLTPEERDEKKYKVKVRYSNMRDEIDKTVF